MIDLENGKNSIVGMGGCSLSANEEAHRAHKPLIIPQREREKEDK